MVKSRVKKKKNGIVCELHTCVHKHAWEHLRDIFIGDIHLHVAESAH